MIRSLLIICFLAACDSAPAASAGASPTRVVSLDYCADQFVLKLLPRESIRALSPDAGKHFSYMRDSADGIPKVRPRAEDVLALQPDLIVRSYGGGPYATEFFGRSGIPVLQVPYTDSIAGIRQSILLMAAAFDELETGEAVVSDMDRRLGAIQTPAVQRSVLYMTPNGVTSGSGTLVHEMLTASGLQNFERREGWHPIPLERLAHEEPDVVAAAFFDEHANRAALWSAMRHPVARRQMENLPTVMLQGAWTSCGGWFLLDAIEALAAVAVKTP